MVRVSVTKIGIIFEYFVNLHPSKNATCLERIEMKKIIIILSLLCISLIASAQAQITTKKEKLSDFTMKTTKIVLTGNEFLDQAIRDAARNSWTISPYEVCSTGEFNTLMKDPKYYFLVVVQFGGKDSSSGISYLSLMKGTQGATKISDLLEVVDFPVCAANFPSGREAVFLPAILDIIQSYVENSIIHGFRSLKATRKLSSVHGMSLYFIEDDLATNLDPAFRAKVFDSNMLLVEEEEQDDIALDGTRNSILSYTITPYGAPKGAVCYRLLIDARTHELYYYKKAKIGASWAGFTKGELTRFASLSR